jgi:hypothetical protein
MRPLRQLQRRVRKPQEFIERSNTDKARTRWRLYLNKEWVGRLTVRAGTITPDPQISIAHAEPRNRNLRWIIGIS